MIKEWRQRGDFNPATVNWPDLLHVEQLQIDDKEPIRLEQEAFLRSRPRPPFTPEVVPKKVWRPCACAFSDKILTRHQESTSGARDGIWNA
jgi:hypothetical protein